MSVVERIQGLLGLGKKGGGGGQRVAATSATVFVDDNLMDVKALIARSATGDLQQRLGGLGEMTGCQLVLLARKLPNSERFEVVESSDRQLCDREAVFAWQHTQPTASASAEAIIAQLPVKMPASKGFISVPIKNELNIPVGVMLGIFQESAVGLDSRTRLMHILSPLFEPEIRCARARADNRQQEQRIASLNQNLEVLNDELRKQRQKQGDGTEYKSMFLRNLSHEIRTPMNVVIGFADLLTETQDAEARHKFAALIKQNSHDMLSLIDNLVELGRMETNYQVRPACAVPLNDLLRDVKKKYDGEFAKNGAVVDINTIYTYQSPKDTIWNSDEIILKVFDILLQGAMSVMKEGTITLTYAIGEQEATFTYTDNRSTEAEPERVGDRSEVSLAGRYLQLCSGHVAEEKPEEGQSVKIVFSIPKEKA